MIAPGYKRMDTLWNDNILVYVFEYTDVNGNPDQCGQYARIDMGLDSEGSKLVLVERYRLHEYSF